MLCETISQWHRDRRLCKSLLQHCSYILSSASRVTDTFGCRMVLSTDFLNPEDAGIWTGSTRPWRLWAYGQSGGSFPTFPSQQTSIDISSARPQHCLSFTLWAIVCSENSFLVALFEASIGQNWQKALSVWVDRPPSQPVHPGTLRITRNSQALSAKACQEFKSSSHGAIQKQGRFHVNHAFVSLHGEAHASLECGLLPFQQPKLLKTCWWEQVSFALEEIS